MGRKKKGKGGQSSQETRARRTEGYKIKCEREKKEQGEKTRRERASESEEHGMLLDSLVVSGLPFIEVLSGIGWYAE